MDKKIIVAVFVGIVLLIGAFTIPIKPSRSAYIVTGRVHEASPSDIVLEAGSCQVKKIEQQLEPLLPLGYNPQVKSDQRYLGVWFAGCYGGGISYPEQSCVGNSNTVQIYSFLFGEYGRPDVGSKRTENNIPIEIFYYNNYLEEPTLSDFTFLKEVIVTDGYEGYKYTWDKPGWYIILPKDNTPERSLINRGSRDYSGQFRVGEYDNSTFRVFPQDVWFKAKIVVVAISGDNTETIVGTEYHDVPCNFEISFNARKSYEKIRVEVRFNEVLTSEYIYTIETGDEQYIFH